MTQRYKIFWKNKNFPPGLSGEPFFFLGGIDSYLIRLQVKVGRNLEMYKNNKASQVYDLQGFA